MVSWNILFHLYGQGDDWDYDLEPDYDISDVEENPVRTTSREPLLIESFEDVRGSATYREGPPPDYDADNGADRRVQTHERSDLAPPGGRTRGESRIARAARESSTSHRNEAAETNTPGQRSIYDNKAYEEEKRQKKSRHKDEKTKLNDNNKPRAKPKKKHKPKVTMNEEVLVHEADSISQNGRQPGSPRIIIQNDVTSHPLSHDSDHEHEQQTPQNGGVRTGRRQSSLLPGSKDPHKRRKSSSSSKPESIEIDIEDDAEYTENINEMMQQRGWSFKHGKKSSKGSIRRRSVRTSIGDKDRQHLLEDG